jgi:hypothetical protein
MDITLLITSILPEFYNSDLHLFQEKGKNIFAASVTLSWDAPSTNADRITPLTG